MDRRRFLGISGAALAAALDLPRPGAAEPPAGGETLYNGIRLPSSPSTSAGSCSWTTSSSRK